MAQILTVFVKANPRPQIAKIRRRLKGTTLTRAKTARKYLQLALDYDNRYKANHDNVPAEKLIFGGDTKAIAAVTKVIGILDAALTSQVQFLPAQ